MSNDKKIIGKLKKKENDVDADVIQLECSNNICFFKTNAMTIILATTYLHDKL